MTRRNRRFLIYIGIVTFGVITMFFLYATLTSRADALFSYAVLFSCVLVLLLPGRIGAWALNDLFVARRLLDVGEIEQSIEANKKFLKLLDQEPWRARWIYVFFGFYSWNSRAMALNNLGAAYMNEGRLEEAARVLRQSIDLDREYAIPHFNLSVLAEVRGEHDLSLALRGKSQELGYKADDWDQVVAKVGSAFASINHA